MKKGIQLVALLLTVVMSSCTGGKDKAAVKQEDEKPRVKVADVTARPVDQIQDYTATVEAEVKNNIAPSSPVRIDRILVEVGDLIFLPPPDSIRSTAYMGVPSCRIRRYPSTGPFLHPQHERQFLLNDQFHASH